MTSEARLRQIARQIRTLPPGVPEVYQRLLAGLQEATDSSVGLFFTVIEVKDDVRFSGIFHTTGDPDADAVMSRAAGRPYRPTFDVTCPPKRQMGRWVDLDEAVPMPREKAAMWRTFYDEPGFDDQLRMLVYDQGRFLGWIGVFRRGRKYDPRTRSQLARLTRATESVVRAAERRAMAKSNAHLPGQLLFDARGRLVGATEGAGAWSMGARRDALASLVRRFDSGGPGIGMVDRARVSLLRLDGSDGVRYLVDLGEARLPRASRAVALSPRQRAVAELAAVGLTAREIAEELDISDHTVRQHLKAVYTRLGVVSRVELREALDS